MANPQCEDGYTALANELLEAIYKTRIPGEAMQVLLVILRKTYGFKKKEDVISLSQFHYETGISKPNVIRAIKTLTLMNLVIKKDNRDTVIYGINKYYATWKPLSKKITLSKKIKNVIEKDNASLSKKIPTKETTTKEKIYMQLENENYLVPENKIDEFISLYPNKDVMGELKKASAWCINNPSQRKTKRGINRFMNGWLSRAAPRLQLVEKTETEIKALRKEAIEDLRAKGML